MGISISHSSTHKCSLMRICSELIEWTYFILANNCMKQCHAICKQCCRQVPIESTGNMCAARIINQTCVPPHPPVLAICSASFDAIRQLKLPNCRSCPPMHSFYRRRNTATTLPAMEQSVVMMGSMEEFSGCSRI